MTRCKTEVAITILEVDGKDSFLGPKLIVHSHPHSGRLVIVELPGYPKRLTVNASDLEAAVRKAREP